MKNGGGGGYIRVIAPEIGGGAEKSRENMNEPPVLFLFFSFYFNYQHQVREKMKKKWDVNVKTFKDREKSVKKRNKDTGINGKQRYALDLRGSIKKKKERVRE